MSFKDKIHELTRIHIDRIPASYQILGDIFLIKTPDMNIKEKHELAKAIKILYPYVKTIFEIKEIKGELREPTVKKLWGNGPETIHTENKIKYKLNAAKIMFSKGNHFERQRLIDKIGENEIVLDMFAGIGYFTLGIAKVAKKVIAVEKNPLAFSYLKENIILNKLNNVEVINDDCRNVKIIADRIMLGYFPHTEQFLETAKLCSRSGTIINFHNTYLEKELWTKPEEEIKAVFGDVKILDRVNVKSIAPRVYHVVVDFEVL